MVGPPPDSQVEGDDQQSHGGDREIERNEVCLIAGRSDGDDLANSGVDLRGKAW